MNVKNKEKTAYKITSLFGDPIDEIPPRKKTGFAEIFKSKNHYRKSDKSEKCANCKYLHKAHHHGKRYNKCDILGDTRGEATDIRISYVCDLYETMA